MCLLDRVKAHTGGGCKELGTPPGGQQRALREPHLSLTGPLSPICGNTDLEPQKSLTRPLLHVPLSGAVGPSRFVTASPGHTEGCAPAL